MMNTEPSTITHEINQRLRGDDKDIDLIELALLIGAEYDPSADLDNCRHELAMLAEDARSFINMELPVESIARDLCEYIHLMKSFTGNRDDYYDPDNSFLDKVIKRRIGIPISLALIYISIGKSLGLSIKGVSFPGNFLVKLERERDVLIDPFTGRVMTRHDCQLLLEKQMGEGAELNELHLKAASEKAILQRMLSNLKLIFLEKQAFEKSLNYCDRLVAMNPNSIQDLLDRAHVLEKLECYTAAANELRHVLSMDIDDKTTEIIRLKVADLSLSGQLKLH